MSRVIYRFIHIGRVGIGSSFINLILILLQILIMQAIWRMVRRSDPIGKVEHLCSVSTWSKSLKVKDSQRAFGDMCWSFRTLFQLVFPLGERSFPSSYQKAAGLIGLLWHPIDWVCCNVSWTLQRENDMVYLLTLSIDIRTLGMW